MAIRPGRGGFLRPFGCGWFIREFLLGHSPEGSPQIDPDIGACQEDIFYHYKLALHRAYAEDAVAWENEARIKDEKPIYTPEEYAERVDEWRHKTHLAIPINIQAIHPANVIPDPSYGGRGFVFEKREKIVLDVWDKWPHWSNPKGKKADKKANYISWWHPKYRCILIDGEPVLKVKGGVAQHNYGFIPYVFIDSGLGNISREAKPEMRYVGILRYMIDLLIAESRDFSISDIVLAKTAWPWGYLTGPNANQVTEIKQTFGTYEPLPDGVELHQVSPEVPPDALNQHLYRTSDYIAAHAAPRSVRGLSESGVRSGADRRLVIAEASARYQYSKDAFKHGTAKVLTNCAKLLKNVIPGDVRVWARTPTDEFDMVVKKDKMKEPFTCYVEFAPISEEDEYRRHDDLSRLIQFGVVTKRWARSQMSNVDPIAMELDEERERLKASPELNAAIDQYAIGKLMEALGRRGEAETITGATTAGAPPGQMLGEGARRMVPPIPQRAPLGSAEDMQNRLRQQRSQQPMFPRQGIGGGGAR